jgi:peptidyl-prolyl cis-trans isomerase C
MTHFASLLQKALPLAVFWVTSAYSAEPVIVQGLSLQITAADIQADAQRIPTEARKAALSKPENIEQLGSNLFVRRALAAQAERDGLGNDLATAALLQIARDRVLSDAQLSRINDANKPADAALDAYASSVYRANASRFMQPEQIRVRHILVSGKETGNRSKAEKILSDIKAGADFATVAKSQSTDPGTAEKGGDLGFFARGRMAPAFEDAAFDLQKPGDLSDVVETQFGYHIIKFEERKTGVVRPFDEVKESLRQEAANKILQEARAAEAQRLLTSARFDKAAIEAFAASQR